MVVNFYLQYTVTCPSFFIISMISPFSSPILWKEASVVDQDRTRKELLLKEALHISLTSEEQHFNRDVGLELQGCWVSTLKALRKIVFYNSDIAV